MDDQYLTHAELVRIWRVIACENLEWGDVDPKFEGMQPGVANIFCPFHENRHSPSARPYWDEKRDILVIHCFREHRTFTVYDYIDLILCKERKQYKDPGEFLKDYFGESEYNELFEIARTQDYALNETQINLKREYIRNVYNEYDNVISFINALYLEKE